LGKEGKNKKLLKRRKDATEKKKIMRPERVKEEKLLDFLYMGVLFETEEERKKEEKCMVNKEDFQDQEESKTNLEPITR